MSGRLSMMQKKRKKKGERKEGKKFQIGAPAGDLLFLFCVPNPAQCKKATFGFDAAEAVPLCFLPCKKKEAREAQISYSQP